MSIRKPAALAVTALVLLTGCGKSADDLFSNLNGTQSSSPPDAGTAGPNGPGPDTPPNHADNTRARHPREMSPEDESRAGQTAVDVERALNELRRRGGIGPAEVRSTLARHAAPFSVTVAGLVPGTGDEAVEGSSFGVWVGKTACVTGAVTEDRVWTEVNGHHPETGCLPPASTH
ncbi:hypothetical protein [Streptomyces sp. BK239]|uniref:hypothetical protein n=1 Tax=Streptomyces sp. BK239 TaxID=2512155 RepID=UPI00102C66EB|nr:hypothetical protein [Streptomyces sp. BK239]